MAEEAAADNANGVSFAEDETEEEETTTPTITHEDLFAAVEDSHISPRPLVNFFNSHKREAICNIVNSTKFNKSRARRLFSALSPILIKIIDDESYLPDEDEDGNLIQDAECTTIVSIQYIKYCANLVESYLDGILTKQRNGRGGLLTCDDEIFEIAQMLHDLLFPLHGVSSIIKEAMHAQSAIFMVCEKFWHGNFDDKEQLVTQLIPLLLMRSLDDNAQKNDVKRLYAMRDAIDLLDFQDESIESLKLHLLRVVANPLFLQSVEGRKFITHLFLVDATLVVDLHRAVRAQIPGAKKSILNAYAEIYYNAWKASTTTEKRTNYEELEEENEEGGSPAGEIQTSIEENALQDFMYQVIHAAVPATSKSVRVVLDRFYVNKKNPDVESALHRMYGPLLWRALSGANARVRIQASVVLTDTFPLRDPNASEEWTEACVTRSVEALLSLMKDDVPSVRVAGSMATAKILTQFWNAVPSKDIRALLNQIIAKHASDASSSAVRASAVNAVTTLLEEDKSHAVLRPLLSNLGNLIHDKTEKVRLAVVNMLLFVKKLPGIKYYHVVPANHLLSRLADEGRGNNNPTGPVAIGLSNLLSNSFFPTGSKKTMTDIINRTLRLFTDSPEAAVVFYNNASSQLSINSIAKLITALMKCLCYFIIEEKRVNSEDFSNLLLVVPEYESIECKGSSNTAQMAIIAESISILWESIEADLKKAENEHAAEMLMEVFSGNNVLTEVYCHFESSAKYESDDMEEDDDSSKKVADCFRACVAILNCAGKVDESNIEGLRTHIVDEISKSTDMSEEQRIKANFSPSFSLLCAWGMTEDVALCLASSIKLYFEGGGTNDASFTRKSKRTQRRGKKANAEGSLPTLDIDVCLGILGHILKGSYPASASARASILNSKTAFDAISSALLTAKNAAECGMKKKNTTDAQLSVATIRHMGIAIEVYGRLLIHKESMRGDMPMKLSTDLKSLMTWATNTVAPFLQKLVRRQDNNTLRDLDLSSIMSVGSPITSPGPRRRSRASFPIDEDIGDASFISANTVEDKSKFTSTRAAAVTAISSVVSTFAEWLTLRQTGDSFVSKQISELCQLLEVSDDKTVRKVLLPLLFHVSSISLRNEEDSAMLFKSVLLSMKSVEPSDTEQEIISRSMASVLSLREDSRLKKVVTTVIHVIRTVVVEAEEDRDDESMVDIPFIDKMGLFMRKVFESVLNGKRSSLILAQCLLEESKASSVRECLFKELDAHSKKTPALQKILDKWTAEKSPSKDETLTVNDNMDKENSHINEIQAEPVAA